MMLMIWVVNETNEIPSFNTITIPNSFRTFCSIQWKWKKKCHEIAGKKTSKMCEQCTIIRNLILWNFWAVICQVFVCALFLTLLAYLRLCDCWFYLSSVVTLEKCRCLRTFSFCPVRSLFGMSLHRVRLCTSIIIMYLVAWFAEEEVERKTIFHSSANTQRERSSCIVNSSYAPSSELQYIFTMSANEKSVVTIAA